MLSTINGIDRFQENPELEDWLEEHDPNGEHLMIEIREREDRIWEEHWAQEDEKKFQEKLKKAGEFLKAHEQEERFQSITDILNRLALDE